MSTFNRFITFIACLSLVLALQGCSFSTSSKSGSDSSGSISDSSSSFSGGTGRYESDVMDYTYAYLKSSTETPDYAGFKKGLSDIAAKRGVSDWESDAHTYKGLGRGLKKAHIEGVSYETYKKNFAEADATKMQQIQQGYDNQD